MILSVLASGFPISPSALPWWGWLLCAAILAVIAFFAFATAELNNSTIGILLSLLLGIATVLSAIVGVVRLVKWIWYS